MPNIIKPLVNIVKCGWSLCTFEPIKKIPKEHVNKEVNVNSHLIHEFMIKKISSQ